MKLSEYYDEIIAVKVLGGRSLEKKNVLPEVAQLETEYGMLLQAWYECPEDSVPDVLQDAFIELEVTHALASGDDDDSQR